MKSSSVFSSAGAGAGAAATTFFSAGADAGGGAACGIGGRTLTNAPLSAFVVSSATTGISRDGSFRSVPFGLARYSATSGCADRPTARAKSLMKPFV